MIVIGGRTQQVTDKVYLEVYDTESSEWHKFFAVQRFRHSSWITDSKVYIHGGFEPEAPSIPTDIINTVDLRKLFEHNTILNKCFKNEPLKQNRSKQEILGERPDSKSSHTGDVNIGWIPTAIACNSENKEFSEVMLDDLTEINKKIIRKDGLNNE